MKRRIIGVLVAISALAFGACEQNGSRSGTAERGGTTSAPTARSPGGETATRPGSSDPDRGASASTSASSSSDLSGTGGSGDAGMGRADAGTKMR